MTDEILFNSSKKLCGIVNAKINSTQLSFTPNKSLCRILKLHSKFQIDSEYTVFVDL